eukprot:Gb_29508 [translate_table: standard]
MEDESSNPHAQSQNFPAGIAPGPDPSAHRHHHHHHQLVQQHHPHLQQQQQQQQHHHALTLSLPSFDQNQATNRLPINPRGHMDAETKPSREDCWSEGATFTLIEAWGDRYVELNRGNLKQKHWKEVAEAVNNRGEGKPPKTDVQCKNRLDTLKKKYKLEKNRLLAGGSSCKWPYYLRLDALIGNGRKDKQPEIFIQGKQRRDTDGNNFNNFNNYHNINIKGEGEEAQQNRFYDNNINNNNSLSNSKWKESPDMTDTCPNGSNEGGEGRKRRVQEGPFRDLAKAIFKFGEVYERVEMAKQQGLMELEKQRMEFAKELEIQRMQMFMQTQLEVARLKRGKRGNTGEFSINFFI